MSTPEKLSLPATNTLQTKIHDVTVRDLNLEALPEFKAMLERNFEHIRSDGKSGMNADDIYRSTEVALTSTDTVISRHLGIWKANTLVGYIDLEPREMTDESESANPQVDIEYLIDQDYSRQGITSAAIEAVVDSENELGIDVIAEVEPHNTQSDMLLYKLDFENKGYDREQGRRIFARTALTEDEMMRRLGM